LMYGWEFPPIQSGGLGVACQGIVEGLLSHNHAVFLVLPKTTPAMQMYSPDSFKVLSAGESGGIVEIEHVATGLYSPYATSNDAYWENLKKLLKEEPNTIYSQNMLEEVYRYAAKAAVHARHIPHDIIHTHDWLTTEAGIQAKKISGQPHIMHVHATEFDRSGDTPNQAVYDLEKRGMEHADRVIAVSEYTKKMLMKYYGIKEWKIDVVHNAVQPNLPTGRQAFSTYHKSHHINPTDKVVLFLGRMTMQKGPDYFLKMAKKVLDHMKRVKFVMAGDGDMMDQIIRLSIDLGIERNVLFSGFLKGDEISRAYAEADLYVMPSVSEPFGLTPLEAIKQGTPVLISKQSGISEVIRNALRVDFWDIDEMANKVIAALRYPDLHRTLRERSKEELDKMSWQKQAGEITKVYQKAINK
ncbi:MAG: glycosyltransferase family 4 protein, partial [Patescibacteria group bacterium]